MNVFVTGGSKGIGKAIVQQLISHSEVSKIYVGSRKPDEVILNEKVVSIELDFLKENFIDSVQSVLKGIPIHILINNAGYLYNGSISETSDEEFSKMMAINYRGPFKLVQGILENLKTGEAHIVNIGSMGGFQGSSKFPGLSIYSSTKAALSNLSECWAEELKPFNIKSNCLALGAVNTEMLKSAFPDYEAPVSASEMAKHIVDFSLNTSTVINGKVLPLSVSTP